MNKRRTIAILLAALIIFGILPVTLAAGIPIVKLGDGAPIPYLAGFTSRLIKDSNQMHGITGKADLVWQQAGNTGSQVIVQVQNIALTDDVLAVFYRAEYEEPLPLNYGTSPISYERAAPYLDPSLNGEPLPIISLFMEGHPDGDKAVFCLAIFSLKMPIPDRSILAFEGNYNVDSKQYDAISQIEIDRSQAKDPTIAHSFDLPLGFTYERYPRQNTHFAFTVRRVSFGPFGNRIRLINLDKGRDSGILDCLLEDGKGNPLPIRNMTNIFNTLASSVNPVEMQNEIWFFGGEGAEAIRIVPFKILSQTAPTRPFHTLQLDGVYPVTLPLKNGSALTILGVALDENGFTVSYTANHVDSASFTPGNSQGQPVENLFYTSDNSFDLPSQGFLAQGVWMTQHEGRPVSRANEQVIKAFTTLLISSSAQDHEIPLPELAVQVPLK
ncbi:MAG: hypothetical protein PHP02_08345 [Eubacteriales bacterium]|nr:hypothetical protein [Eubacteriales bacterium]